MNKFKSRWEVVFSVSSGHNIISEFIFTHDDVLINFIINFGYLTVVCSQEKIGVFGEICSVELVIVVS